jgi:hypothetical protein
MIHESRKTRPPHPVVRCGIEPAPALIGVAIATLQTQYRLDWDSFASGKIEFRQHIKE